MDSYKILIKIRESRKKSREKRDTEQTNTINTEELKHGNVIQYINNYFQCEWPKYSN